MGKILAPYMKLVPTVEAEGHLQLPNGSVIAFDDTRFFSILFGGDQLTIARNRGTQVLRDTQERRCDRFEGVLPVVEDWHSRMTVESQLVSIPNHTNVIYCCFCAYSALLCYIIHVHLIAYI